MSTSATFWTRAARSYASQPISNPTNYQDTLARTAAHLVDDGHLLELGCGTGPTALSLARHVGQVTATDFAEGMIEIANERLATEGAGNVTFRTATISEACGDGPYDAIAAFNLLHLIDDLDGTLKAVNAGLKPGGVFISKSACLSAPIPFLWPVVRLMQAFGKAPYVRFMSQRRLLDDIQSAGFEIVETHVYGRWLPSVFVVARRQTSTN